jgi:3-dehydroquinate dehydratase-2
LTNIYAREPYRSKSVVSDACVGGVFGFGPDSYRLGLQALIRHLG